MKNNEAKCEEMTTGTGNSEGEGGGWLRETKREVKRENREFEKLGRSARKGAHLCWMLFEESKSQ